MDLSLLIPARNEEYLARTIQDILEHIEGDSEIIAVLDGNWPNPPIEDHPRVHLIYHSESIGQRAATNEAARMSTAKYVMKLDAHCAVDQGFDVKLMADMQDDWTMVPIMRNLHVFDWVCECGYRQYQGPTPEACRLCGKPLTKEICWIAKPSPQSKAYCFDSTPHFQYFREFSKRPEGRGELTETMSLQGSCFMMTRQKYLDLNICDEEFGSWGSQGIEVACKTWLSGGRVIVSHKTFYAHLFRTQGADFGFPYPLSGKQTDHAKARARELFFEGKWDKAIRPLSWLVERFWPVPGWTEEQLNGLKDYESKNLTYFYSFPPKKGIVYYTDNRLDSIIMTACQRQLTHCANGHQVVSVSLAPLDFGENITLEAERGIFTMFRQILAGLEASTAEVIFLAEHDLIYHPSHFDFTPPRRDVFYYNENTWKIDAETGQALFYYTKQTSGLCAYRELLIEHYRKRIERVKREGRYDRAIGFEPGCHSFPRGIDNYPAERWMSDYPNLDIRHGKNLTPSRWSPDQFRSQRNCQGWTMADSVPGWGMTKGRFQELLQELTNGNH
jgi:glycosyltransferase involved in cell wall biosynthesis